MPGNYGVLLNLIKTIASQTNEASVPADIVIGEVTQVNPLVIQLESKLPIPESNILLTKNTSLWSVDMTVNHNTEDASGGSGDAAYAPHHHGYKGTKTYLVHNELAVGDKVILLRESGGQRFIALDRVHNPDRGCND